jgi:hypothetical protein
MGGIAQQRDPAEAPAFERSRSTIGYEKIASALRIIAGTSSQSKLQSW